MRDSNPRSRDQNPLPYRLANSQTLLIYHKLWYNSTTLKLITIFRKEVFPNMHQQIPYETLLTADAGALKNLLEIRYSILKSIGANKLRLGMALVGKVCQFFIWLIFFRSRNIERIARRRATIIVKFFFPVTIKKNYYPRTTLDTAVVLYINHQSLFEILATIWYCLSHFTDHKYLFPVNLPWYEALTPVIDKLGKLGITITPMITPSTYKKLERITSDTEHISHIKSVFETEYSHLVSIFVQNNNIVVVAPSATRTEHIFPSQVAYLYEDIDAVKDMPRTMTAIFFSLRRTKNLTVDFVPFVVTRKRPAGKGLNIWRRHSIYVGPANTLEEFRAESKDDLLDYNCYQRLCRFLPDHVKYPTSK